jgi:2-(1,2-epoxy-1,2-dihydrophenyl)acetyl-CoA isomerase
MTRPAGTFAAAEPVRLEISDSVAELTLCRAEARNAINPEWVEALARAVSACSQPGIRAVLIRADGPAFTVGGDLKHFSARLDTLSAELREMIDPYHAALAQLAALPVPVVCAAQGAIAGGGLGLLWASDVVLLSDDARLATAFAQLGLSGDGGSSWYLPRMIGTRRALVLLLSGRQLGAEEALELGLVDRVVDGQHLVEAARSVAREFASGPTVALGEIRRLVRGAFERTLAEGLDAELEASARCGATADAREGVQAFRERRAPHFGGE